MTVDAASVTVSRTERPSLATRPRFSSPSSASLLTIVLTLLGASRSSAAASATPMPGRRAASRSSSDRAGGNGSAWTEVRTARRATRLTAPMAASSWAAWVFASSGGELTSFTELTVWEPAGARQEGQEGQEVGAIPTRRDGTECHSELLGMHSKPWGSGLEKFSRTAGLGAGRASLFILLLPPRPNEPATAG